MSESSERVIHLEKKSLRRVLGARELFAVGYGDVGSSIYYALGVTALYALGATPLALLIAGFVFICTAMTYSEMATTFPEPGGSATFCRYAFNDLASFIAGWGLLLDYIVTTAISAFAIPPYLSYVLPFTNSTAVHIGGTIAIIAVLYMINVFGVKGSGKFSWILALVTILSQALVILIAAALLMNLPFIISHLKIGAPDSDWSPDWWSFMKGTSMAMVAYTGIEAIAQLAAEANKPAVTIPKAIKWTVGSLVTLYFFISVVGLSVVSPKELGTTYIDDPIAGIIVHFPFGGQWLAPWFGIIAAAILLIASNAGLIGCSRLSFSMGEYYQIPHFFYKLHKKFRTPHVSLAIFAFFACLIVLLSRGEMLFLADLYNFGAQIAFFSAHMSLLVLRWKKPSLSRPYKAPLNIPFGKGRSLPLTAILGALATFCVWLMVIITKPEGRYLGFGWLAVGIAMFYFYRKKKQLSVTGKLSIEKVKIPEYRPMHLKHVLVTARALGNAEGLQTACQLAKSFNAKITAVHILEVPPALPINAPMPKGEEAGESALKRAEAVAREYQISIDLKLVKARSFRSAILELIQDGVYDMIIISARKDELQHHSRFIAESEKILKKAPCRVLFCKT